MSKFSMDLVEKETELRNKLTKIKSLTIAKLKLPVNAGVNCFNACNSEQS